MQQTTSHNAFIISYDDLFSETSSAEGDGAQNSGKAKKSYYTHAEVEELLKAREEEMEERFSERLELEVQRVKIEATELGRVEAERSMEDQFGRMMQSLSDEKRLFEDQFQAHLQEIKPVLINLVFELAEKIIGVATVDSELRSQLAVHLQSMIDTLKENEPAILEVSEHDYTFISNAFDSLSKKIDITLVSDSDLQSGEFRLKTEEKQIMKIYRKILSDFRESVTLNGAHNDQNEQQNDD